MERERYKPASRDTVNWLCILMGVPGTYDVKGFRVVVGSDGVATSTPSDRGGA